jgi:PAS domain S-box-containing protein
MMKLGLRIKYTLFLAGLAVSAAVVMGSTFLFQAHVTAQNMSESRAKAIDAALADEMRERSQNLGEILSASLSNLLYSGQYQDIDVVTRGVLALKDVEDISVYDVKARLIYKGVTGKADLNDMASREARNKVLVRGQWIFSVHKNLAVYTGPIRRDGMIIGAVSLILRDNVLSSSLGRMNKELDNIWDVSLKRFVSSLVIVLIFFLATSIVIGAYAAGRLSEPIEALAAAAKRIGEGRYDIDLPGHDQDEIGELTSALGRMAKTLKKSTVSVDYLDDIIGNMREGLIVTDHSGRIEKVNRSAAALSGFGEGELIGQPVSLLLPPPVDGADGEVSQSPESSLSLPSALHTKNGGQVPVLLSHATIKSHADENPGKVYVFNDITGIKQREAELGAARDEAQIANRSKSQFLATMSHELRTPLNAIIGFSSMLKDQIGGPLSEKYQSYAQDIYESADHLLMIINDLLDISKLEAGKMELTEEPVELSEVVNAAVRLVREKARSKGIEIELIGIETVPAIYGDRRMAKQMVTNLLSNAYKFNVDGGRITVKTIYDPATGLDLKVSDTGIGIAKEDMVRVALPFSQVENHISRNFQGTGLGLAITKSMMELHGGDLLLESEKGQGTTVTLHFPPSRVEAS